MTAAAVVSALVALTVVLPALASRSIIPASGSNTCNAAPWRVYRPSNEVRRPGFVELSDIVCAAAYASAIVCLANVEWNALHVRCYALNRLRRRPLALRQAAVKCFGKQLKLQNVQNFAHPPVPVADAPAWEAAAAAPSAAHVLQFGPQPSALCLPGKKGSPIKQTVKPGIGQTCCSSGADCELKAGDYTFFDTTCAVLHANGVLLSCVAILLWP